MNFINSIQILILFILPAAWSGSFYGNSFCSDDLFRKGIISLNQKDTTMAEKYFSESIRLNNNADSYYELAKILLNRNTYLSRNRAFEISYMAVLLQPDNIKFSYLYASIAKDFAKFSAIDQYKKIISLDSSQVEAWYQLGSIKEKDFTEYDKSVRNVDGFISPLQEYANEDFNEAEKYFLQALKFDSTNYKTSLKLSLMYDLAGKSKKGIPLLKRLIETNRDDKDVHLCLGLLFYKTDKFKDSFEEYKKALDLMNKEEIDDFTLNSVKFLLSPVLSDSSKQMNDYDYKEFIDIYWKSTDPLYLTEYNERLLEHYSRVAFANLHFSVPSLKIVGWKSNRGETILRYGEPLNRMRIRPSIGDKISMKTEVWNYNGFSLGFTDMTSSGNYLFAAPAGEKDKNIPQFPGDSQSFIEDLKKGYYTFYNPKYEGPKFDIVYDVYQFKNKDVRNHSDLYINYGLIPIDSLLNNGTYNLAHTSAFFLLNDYSNMVIENKEKYKNLSPRSVISTISNPILYTNILKLPVTSDSGNYSFEILRDFDKGVSTNRGKIKIRKFSNTRLDVSDILLASRIETERAETFTINRSNVNILSNPTNQFINKNPLYVYYEVYNLKKDETGLTDFEQEVEISEYEEEKVSDIEKAISAVKKFLGISKGEEISFSSNYQSKEVNPQIYYRLDLAKAKTGKYVLRITVKDKIANSKISVKTIIDWIN